MLERFDSFAKASVQDSAPRYATTLGHERVGSAALLLGVLTPEVRRGGDLLARVIQINFDVTREDFLNVAQDINHPVRRGGNELYTANVIRACAQATEFAGKRFEAPDDFTVTNADLIVGIIHTADMVITDMFQKLGVDLFELEHLMLYPDFWLQGWKN